MQSDARCEFIEELLKLGDPKEVRIIFWLDW
jgi:hypothetical protein